MEIELRDYVPPSQTDDSMAMRTSVVESDEGIPNQVLPGSTKTKSRLSDISSCQVDLTDHFNKIFVKKTFNSFKEFDELFIRFKKETGSVFRIKSSCSIAYENARRKQHFIPPRFKFVSIKYCCVHYGQPKVSGQGIRTKQRYLPCGCGCVLSLAYNRGALFISHAFMQHNHEVSDKTAPYYAINRRINKQELRQIADIISVMPNSRALQCFLMERFQRPMTLQDAKNTMARLKAMQLKQGQIESIEVIPSFKEISQIQNENDCRAVLEIKAESEEKKKTESPLQQESSDSLHEDHCEEIKSKMISEVVRKFSELMIASDSSQFWERIDLMNKVFECWENGETLNVQYSSSCAVESDSFDPCSEAIEVESSHKTEVNHNPSINVSPDRSRISDTNGDVYQQELAEKQLKLLLPILSDSVQFVPTSAEESLKFVLPEVKSKIDRSHCTVKRPRGRPRNHNANSIVRAASDVSCNISRHKKILTSDSKNAKDSDKIGVSESKTEIDNENDKSNSHFNNPFISCIKKETCTDQGDQALLVEIEINDASVK